MPATKIRKRATPKRRPAPDAATIRAPESFDSKKAMRVARQLVRDNAAWFKEMAEK